MFFLKESLKPNESCKQMISIKKKESHYIGQ
jgi:hypothetical protein